MLFFGQAELYTLPKRFLLCLGNTVQSLPPHRLKRKVNLQGIRCVGKNKERLFYRWINIGSFSLIRKTLYLEDICNLKKTGQPLATPLLDQVGVSTVPGRYLQPEEDKPALGHASPGPGRRVYCTWKISAT
jgi:hypothetical protein